MRKKGNHKTLNACGFTSKFTRLIDEKYYLMKKDDQKTFPNTPSEDSFLKHGKFAFTDLKWY